MHKLLLRLKKFLVTFGFLIMLFSIIIKYLPASSTLKHTLTPSGLMSYANAFFLLAVLIKLHEVCVRLNLISHHLRESSSAHVSKEAAS
ncbi:MAG: hypothetical protein KJ880_07075 [Candidatus Omnitrophica bacterium]|nr:hypothetical protein [Candidatus Omnitrophota bacterium]MBU1869818.1 hypothetical protein [Candidatus Omnitrophota bacterium]